MPLLLDIAWTHIKSRRRQTIISVLGVMLGVGFFIAVSALMQGSEDDFVTRIIDASPHVAISDEYRAPAIQPVVAAFKGNAVALRGEKPKSELRGIRHARQRLSELDGMDGASAAPTLRGQAVIRYGGRDVAATIMGIEPRMERRVSQIEADLTEGTLFDLYTSANAVIVGAGLAERLGAERGSTLIVSSAEGVVLPMRVVGLFRSGNARADNAFAYALIKRVQVLLNRPNVINEIRVRLDDASEARSVARRIEGRIGYRAESWDEANEGLLETFETRNRIMFTVVSAILLVAGFGIYNIVSTITYEKSRDIAILKSLGFPQRDIRRIFLLEGLVIGAGGIVLGSILGYALSGILDRIEVNLGEFGGTTTLPVTYSISHYLIAAVFALLAAGIAGYLPARKAARLNPVDIIRGAA